MDTAETNTIELPEPAVYTPFESGVYTISAGLQPMDRSFGNGAADARVFQIDKEFLLFRENLNDVRARDDIRKYWGESERFDEPVRRAVISFMVRRLAKEYPDWFSFTREGDDVIVTCALTNETLHIDRAFNLIPHEGADYETVFDAIASQVQEDLAIVIVDDDGDRVAALHVTAPNYWDPAEKLDKNFGDVHVPVAGIEALLPKAGAMMRAMTRDARYQRFVWGLTTDRRLNHHPVPPRGFTGPREDWYGRRFDPAAPELYVRVERQAIVGFAEVSAFLFCIRPYFVDCETLTPEQRAALRDGLLSMSPEARVYKGVAESFDDIVSYLEG